MWLSSLHGSYSVAAISSGLSGGSSYGLWICGEVITRKAVTAKCFSSLAWNRQRQRLSLPGRALYRPPGIPVLVGSDTFGRVHSGIPTQRPGPRGLSAASEAKDAIATSGASRTAKVQSYTGGQAPTSRSRVGTYRALKGQGRLEAVQRAPNTQVQWTSELTWTRDGVL